MSDRGSYHHGDLAVALRDHATSAVRDKGGHAVSLRSVARAAGVDIAAVYRHYRNKTDLLAAVAAHAFGTLGERMLATMEGATTARERMMATGRAYVEFALDEPALFQLMFGPMAGIHDHTHRTETRPYALLVQSIRDLAEAHGTTRSEQEAVLLAWSAVHGLAALGVDGRLADAEARAGIDVVVGSVVDSLTP